MGCQNSQDQRAHACCPPGSWPALQVQYTPTGKTVKLEGLTLYETGTGSKTLVLFQDIFGIESGRHKTVADTYASLGFKVYLPELLEPVYIGSIEDVPKIIEVCQQQKLSTIKAKYEILSNYIKTQGSQTFVAAGFCWGVWAAFRMSADYNNIKAIAAMHPSLNVQNFYSGNEVKLVQAVKCPVFFYACSNDQPGTKKGGQYVTILTEKFGDKVGTEDFPDQMHGFVIRSDPKIESARRDIQKIIKMSLQYFARFP